MTEDEMVGWHHLINRYEFKQAPGDGEGQRSLAGYGPWGHRRVRHDLVTKQQQTLPIAYYAPSAVLTTQYWLLLMSTLRDYEIMYCSHPDFTDEEIGA